MLNAKNNKKTQNTVIIEKILDYNLNDSSYEHLYKNFQVKEHWTCWFCSDKCQDGDIGICANCKPERVPHLFKHTHQFIFNK